MKIAKDRIAVLLLAAAAGSGLVRCSSGSPSFDGWKDQPSVDAPDVGDVIPDVPAEEAGVCAPGEGQCVSNVSYRRCRSDGSGWEAEQACEAGKTCHEGNCFSACEYAETKRSSIGCVFYALDMDQYDDGIYDFDSSPYAIVTSNIDDTFAATVTVERKAGASWSTVETQTIPPNSLYTFRLPGDSHVELTNLLPGAAYRVTSDYPIIAYQFNPIDTADQQSNDASTLLPVHTLDRWYFAASWHQFSTSDGMLDLKGYVDVVGTRDGTTVTVNPSAQTVAGGPVPAIPAGGTYTATLNDGDVLQIATQNDAGDLTGTYVEASDPVAVFGGHECADVPYLCSWCRNAFGTAPGATHRENTCAWCDHLEEQIFPLTTWGKNFVASRVPARSTGGLVEATFWRVVASEDATTVGIEARAGITLRFPSGVVNPAVINRGQYVEFEMVGTQWDPGDSFVEADKPILLVQVIEGQECTNVDMAGGGDPALISMVPVEQFLDKYIFLTPLTYDVDFVIITRPAGSVITLDGAPVDSSLFIPVAAGWEVARATIADGVHTITGTAAFGIVSVGYSPYVSYGYPGGMSLEIINPMI